MALGDFLTNQCKLRSWPIFGIRMQGEEKTSRIKRITDSRDSAWILGR